MITRLLKGLVNVVVGIAVLILGFRFIFKLFSANATNGLVEWVYNSSDVIMAPFRGIFPAATVEGSVIDFPALLAIVIYGVLGLLIVYIVDILSPTKKRR